LNRPQALAIAPDGDLLIANQGTNQIIARTPSGTLTVVAGNGTAGYAGNGRQAIDAELDDPAGMAVETNGTIYVADTANNRVRAISPSGIITTVAGNGRLSFTGLGGPATRVAVPQPVALALGSKGQLYVADDAGIQLVSPNGVLSTLVHAGVGALTVDGTPTAFSPDAIALGTNGYLYVADFSPKLLVELTPKGKVIDSWPISVTTAGLATAADGAILVADYGHFTVDRITNDQLTVVTAFTRNSPSGLAGAFRPSGVAVTNAGQVYVDTDGVNGGSDTPAIATVGATGQPRLLTTGARTSH
jgi:serine/threonine-protein kinase